MTLVTVLLSDADKGWVNALIVFAFGMWVPMVWLGYALHRARRPTTFVYHPHMSPPVRAREGDRFLGEGGWQVHRNGRWQPFRPETVIRTHGVEYDGDPDAGGAPR